MRKKKHLPKKQSIAATIRRRQTPPSPPITINLQLEKNQKVLSHHQKKKKIVKLTQCTTLYSRLERITTSKSKRSWETLVQTKNQQKSRSHLYNSWSSKHNSELGFFLWKHNFELFWFVPCLYQRTPGFVRAFPVARALVFRFRWVSVL